MDEPNLRAAAMADVDKEWEAAIVAGAELHRIFDRLAEALHSCAARGGTMDIAFPLELTQNAWVDYRERAGEMVPRHPGDPPPMMKLEGELGHSLRAVP